MAWFQVKEPRVQDRDNARSTRALESLTYVALESSGVSRQEYRCHKYVLVHGEIVFAKTFWKSPRRVHGRGYRKSRAGKYRKAGDGLRHNKNLMQMRRCADAITVKAAHWAPGCTDVSKSNFQYEKSKMSIRDFGKEY